MESCKLIQDYTRKHIDRALQQSPKLNHDTSGQRNCILLHELVKETKNRDELCSQLLNVFFAGRDTPAVALTNTIFMLARHPKVWKNCRSYVEPLRKEDLTFERLKSLRYIQHVINEGKRSAVPSNASFIFQL